MNGVMMRSAIESVDLDPYEAMDRGDVVDLRSDGVIHVFWQPDRTVDATDARAAVAAVNRISRAGEYPLLIDVSRTEEVRHDARSIFAEPWPASRVELLGSKPADKFVATLFLRAGTPLHPTRFFTSRTEAISWLSPGPDERAAG